MSDIQNYHKASFNISKLITHSYSTSFSMGIKAFAPEYRDPVYSIYGYVRLADEIVDSFHGYDKRKMLNEFRDETFESINKGISTNPVIHTFQQVVNKYKIDHELVEDFLKSMEMDLEQNSYARGNYDNYIYGSAEVVGLMCLKVFCLGDEKKYAELKEPARALGSAFQKVNFLRDMKSDFEERGRIYLPDVHDVELIDDRSKTVLEDEVEREFQSALTGILKLPLGVRLGVYSAYYYYFALFNKIKRMEAKELLKRRVRISNLKKFYLLIKSIIEIKVLRIA